ncbi:putative galactinol-sucrose galactosyltransferase 2 [Auxenochlorella protothecoides]|uniref:galactinol--sucrose galactosyltransferase n=2 Tax=Auxenochlorella protothecoides TaxID=3075 RepID=A0A087SN21_AUXPR|nr:putative galactinol-sucrose galactosyltransferase 2 [Auxenochlorella protothecoides]KFM27125.1 putative galactinol-sucrose galactosyltransferase 2 [Auxenochlorella protothecoides]
MSGTRPRPKHWTAGTSGPVPYVHQPLPLAFVNGSVVGEAGPILQGLPSTARGSELEGGVLLSLASPDGPVSSTSFRLGKLPAPSRFLALGLTSVWWMTPAWGSCASWVPLETQFLLLELPEGAGCAVLLPLLSNHGTFRASLAGSGPGSEDPALHLHVDSGDAGVMTQTWTDVFYIAAGKEVYPLVDAAVATAGRLSGGARPRTSKAVPDFVDTFGWCTWDAFYYDVTPAGILDGVQALQVGGINPGFVIIDDGIQEHHPGLDPSELSVAEFLDAPEHRATNHGQRLLTVKANSKFRGLGKPRSLALNEAGGKLGPVVDKIKDMGVRHVIAWHALCGFWGGLSDELGEQYEAELIMPDPPANLLALNPETAWIPPSVAGVRIPRDPTALHTDMHAYLAGCGVDGVKVDVQSTLGLLGGATLAGAYNDSLEASVARHFPGNQLINCMCHSTVNLYRFSQSNLARASDDFWPLIPASHTAHIANCAYNSAFMGALVVPDFDMFHSRHPAALMHATARVVSGGPVYVSDRPGAHDFDLLRRIVLRDGSTLRTLSPGRPTPDSLFADVCRDGKSLLKVQSWNATGAVVAAFNLQGAAYDRSRRAFHVHDASPPRLTAGVGVHDVPGLAARCSGLPVIAYCDADEELTVLRDSDAEEVRVSLTAGGSCLVTLAPVLAAGGVSLAPVGLVNMLNVGGAVLGWTWGAAAPAAAPSAEIRVRGSGTLLCWASREPARLSLPASASQNLTWQFDDQHGALRITIPDMPDIEQDICIAF